MRTDNNKILALNMIIGKGDGDYLERCLQSANALNFFDEVILVRTTEDKRVKEVCDLYATTHIYSEWETKEFPHGNFSEKRNIALKHTSSKYVMWMDADDTLSPECLPAITEIKELLKKHDFDFYKCPYHLEVKEDGTPLRSLMKARIFKTNCGIKWIYPVHEQLTIDFNKQKSATIKNLVIQHRKDSGVENSIKRNLKILRNEIKKDNSISHTKYFYAKELVSDYMGNKNKESKEKAINIFKDIILNENGSPYEILHSCIEISMLLFYDPANGLRPDGCPVRVSKKDVNLSETFCRIALSYSENYAEPLCILGDIYNLKDELEHASNFYIQALSKNKEQEGGIQRTAMYSDIPHLRMLYIFKRMGKFEEALLETRVLLFQKGCIVSKDNLIRERTEILETLSDLTKEYIERYNENALISGKETDNKCQLQEKK